MGELKIGDTIKCKDTKDLKATALELVKLGYEVECKGWEGISNNKLTITKEPEETWNNSKDK